MIYDCQIDSGNNVFGPNSRLETYDEEAPIQYSEVIVIPTGTHRLKVGQETEVSCLWKPLPKILFYKKTYMGSKEVKCEQNPENPYLNMNIHILKSIRELNRKSKRHFNLAPKFHPHLDTLAGLERFLDEPETVAIKIQGIASYSSPSDVPKWFLEEIRKRDLPLMVHTDYNFSEDSKHNPWMNYIVNSNNALNWAAFALRNNIRVYLAHGAKLSRQASELVNKYDNFLVGIGPDLMLNEEQESLQKSGEYLDNLFGLFSLDKIAFNTDFSWNVQRRNQWNVRDWKSHERVINKMTSKGLRDSIDSVLWSNAKRFFG